MAKDTAQDVTTRGAKSELPAAEEARTAVLHFEELVAAFDGEGVAVDGADETESAKRLADDCKTLAEVTQLLLAHRHRQRRPQQDARGAALVREVADVYKGIGREGATAYEIEQRLIERLRAKGIFPTDEELDELVILRDTDTLEEDCQEGEKLDELTIKNCLGPLEAAKATVSRVVGPSPRTLATARQREPSLLLARVAFGRWVPRRARDRYVARLHKSAENTTPPKAQSVRSFFEPEETTGAWFDSVVEDVQTECFTTELGLLEYLDAEPRTPQMAQFQERFARQWMFNYALILGVIAVAPAVAGKIVEGVPHLGAPVREAVDAVVTALKADDEAAVRDAERALKGAVCAGYLGETLGELRKHFKALEQEGS